MPPGREAPSQLTSLPCTVGPRKQRTCFSPIWRICEMGRNPLRFLPYTVRTALRRSSSLLLVRKGPPLPLLPPDPKPWLCRITKACSSSFLTRRPTVESFAPQPIFATPIALLPELGRVPVVPFPCFALGRRPPVCAPLDRQVQHRARATKLRQERHVYSQPTEKNHLKLP